MERIRQGKRPCQCLEAWWGPQKMVPLGTMHQGLKVKHWVEGNSEFKTAGAKGMLRLKPEVRQGSIEYLKSIIPLVLLAQEQKNQKCRLAHSHHLLTLEQRLSNVHASPLFYFNQHNICIYVF